MWKVQFDLTNPSPISLDFVINDISVWINENLAQINADNVQAVNQNAASSKALYAATCCLNYICWKYDVVLNINPLRLGIDEIDPTRKIVGQAGYGSVDAKTMVHSSRVQSPISISGKKSDAAHYYRKGCLSNDSFDQFRNLYSAVEIISHKIYKKQPDEPGKIELDRALLKCFDDKVQFLYEVAKVIPTYNSQETTISEVVRILYKANLCELNHHKTRVDNTAPPVALQDEMELMDALPLLKFVAKALLEYEESSP